MDASPSSPPRLRLLREDAAGPISAVFAAQIDTPVGTRRVAVKLLRELPEGGVEHLFDLRDRARRIGRLGHRHHACVTDLALVDVRLALVSPYIDGIDLLDWMDVLSETGRIIPRRVTCEILRCVAVALEVARSGMPGQAGLAPKLGHRDLKPTNVIISRDGEIKVTDFATGYTSLAGRSSRSGALKKGLVRYFSPERRDGRRVAEAADVYALGILALELFRGRWLRRLRSQNPAHDRHLSDVVARLEDLQMRSDSDERALRNLLLRMVAFDPDARPAVSEIASAFRDFTDRGQGPSLEAFAHAHAVPWLEDTPTEPDPRLADVSAVLLERGQPLPELGGQGLSVVTLPDRYDLQLQRSSGSETGDWTAEEIRAEVTDPRIRNSGDHVRPDDIEDGFTESAEVEEADPAGPAPEEELWGDVTEPLVRPVPVGSSSPPPTPGRTTPLAQPQRTPNHRDRVRTPAPGVSRGTTEIVLDDDDLIGSGPVLTPPVEADDLGPDLMLDDDEETDSHTVVAPRPGAPAQPAPPEHPEATPNDPPAEVTDGGRSVGMVVIIAVVVGVMAVVGLAATVVIIILFAQF